MLRVKKNKMQKKIVIIPEASLAFGAVVLNGLDQKRQQKRPRAGTHFSRSSLSFRGLRDN